MGYQLVALRHCRNLERDTRGQRAKIERVAACASVKDSVLELGDARDDLNVVATCARPME